jgi:hypothetical protein
MEISENSGTKAMPRGLNPPRRISHFPEMQVTSIACTGQGITLPE